VLMVRGGQGQADRMVYTLYTDDGARYNLKVAASRRWWTHMRLKVNGRLAAAAAGSPSTAVGSIPNLIVDRVVSASSLPPTGRFQTAGVQTAHAATGTAPADMSVLFIIVSMCGLNVSITPTVRVRL
jgi:hypothetical protein